MSASMFKHFLSTVLKVILLTSYPAFNGCLASSEQIPVAIREIQVANSEELQSALAGARGGDHVILQNNTTYSVADLKDGSKWFHLKNDPKFPATAEAPIVVRALGEPLVPEEAPTLVSSLVIESNHALVHRLHFTGDQWLANLEDSRPAVLEIHAGKDKSNGKDVTIQGCWFKDITAKDGLRVGDDCHRAVIQYCYFKDRLTGPISVKDQTYISDAAAGDYPMAHGVAEDVHIRYCHFDTTHPDSTGGCAVRIGRREDDTARYTNWLIEFCLLVEQNGNEVIQNKSSGNIYRYLTFLNCDSKAQFRWGNDNKFQGFWMEDTMGIFLRGERNEVNGVKFLKGDGNRSQFLKVWAGSVRADEVLYRESPDRPVRGNRSYAIPLNDGFVGEDESKHPNAQDCFIFNFETDTPGSLEIGSNANYPLVKTVGYPPENITIEGLKCSTPGSLDPVACAISYNPGYFVEGSYSISAELSPGRETYAPIKLSPADVGPNAGAFTGFKNAWSNQVLTKVSIDGYIDKSYSDPYPVKNVLMANPGGQDTQTVGAFRIVHDPKYIHFIFDVQKESPRPITSNDQARVRQFDGVTLALNLDQGSDDSRGFRLLHFFPTLDGGVVSGTLSGLAFTPEGPDFFPGAPFEGISKVTSGGWFLEGRLDIRKLGLKAWNGNYLQMDVFFWNHGASGPEVLAWSTLDPQESGPGNWGKLTFTGGRHLRIPEVSTETIALDLVIDETYGPANILNSYSSSNRPAAEDLSAEWYLAHDGEYLYFYFDIKDDRRGPFTFGSTSLDPYKSDALVVAIDGDNSKGCGMHGAPDGIDDWQIDIAVQSDGGLLAWTRSPSNPNGGFQDEIMDDPLIEGISEQHSAGYRLEFRLPMLAFGILPVRESLIGLDVRLSDYDGRGVPIEYLTWNRVSDFLDNPISWGTAEIISQAELQAPFDGVSLPSDPGWCYSRWFGWYYQVGGSNWYYQEKLGWIYTQSQDNIQIYIWDGWQWYFSCVALFPWAYAFGSSGWISLYS